IWRRQGFPPVSVIKIDIEGGEHLALQGAKQVIESTKPALIIEWNEENIRPYGLNVDHLFEICADLGYDPHAIPSLTPVQSRSVLRMAMAQTDMFVLVPRGQRLP